MVRNVVCKELFHKWKPTRGGPKLFPDHNDENQKVNHIYTVNSRYNEPRRQIEKKFVISRVRFIENFKNSKFWLQTYGFRVSVAYEGRFTGYLQPTTTTTDKLNRQTAK